MYGDVAAIISNQAETNGRQPLAGMARRRLASLVPALEAARPPVREPEWISSQLQSARGGQTGSQLAGFGGGQWRGRGNGAWGACITTPIKLKVCQNGKKNVVLKSSKKYNYKKPTAL